MPLCSEIAAGFFTPRAPADIVGARDGHEFSGGREVMEDTGRDVTDLYLLLVGSLSISLKSRGCRYAVLTDGSLSCGSTFIYDGLFQGNAVAGQGTTVALLECSGIRVYSETRIDDLDRVLASRRS